MFVYTLVAAFDCLICVGLFGAGPYFGIAVLGVEMDPKETENGCGEKQTDPKDEGSISTSSVVASCNPSASDAVEEEELEKLKGEQYHFITC